MMVKTKTFPPSRPNLPASLEKKFPSKPEGKMYVKRAVKENSAFDVNALMSDLSVCRPPAG
jgi:hypothetical protein